MLSFYKTQSYLASLDFCADVISNIKEATLKGWLSDELQYAGYIALLVMLNDVLADIKEELNEVKDITISNVKSLDLQECLKPETDPIKQHVEPMIKALETIIMSENGEQEDEELTHSFSNSQKQEGYRPVQPANTIEALSEKEDVASKRKEYLLGKLISAFSSFKNNTSLPVDNKVTRTISSPRTKNSPRI